MLTLRALLIRPFLVQIRSGRALQALAPQLAELRRRHKDNPQRLVESTRALYAEHGVRPSRAFLPALVQIPVFVGLLHVLTSFNRAGVTPEQNAAIPNYAFGPAEVGSFLQAHLFGVPLPAYLSMPQDLLDAFGAHVDRWQVGAVAVPLMLLAALATHLSARVSASRQPADGPGAALVRWTPWVFPLGVLVSGAFFPFPLATLLYWMTNSGWTVVQQWLVLHPAPAAPPPEPVASIDRAAARRRAEAELRRRRRKVARSS